MARILVTGGAGFIGSHVSDKFLAAGHEVVIVDNLSTGKRENIPQDAEFCELDISDPKLADIFEKYEFDIVVHHAAQIDVRTSMRIPAQDAEINVVGSLKLIELCRKYSVNKFHFASTGGVIYGDQDYHPADEKHPARPVCIYGVDKLAIEQYLYVFHVDCGINVTCLRYGNVYGPRQNPFGEAGVIAIFANKMLSGEQAVINGDGTQTRDYVFVGDIARINLAALELTGYNILNAGTGIETDVNKIFSELNKLTGADQPEKHTEAKPGEQMRSCIDSALAKKMLDWEAEVGLEAGLRETVEWFKGR